MYDLKLTNGQRTPIKINFLTTKLMVDEDIEKLSRQAEKHPDNAKLQMKLASKLVYIILRSNGLRVDEEEAAMLVPMDDEIITAVFQEFAMSLEEFKKKQESRIQPAGE